MVRLSKSSFPTWLVRKSESNLPTCLVHTSIWSLSICLARLFESEFWVRSLLSWNRSLYYFKWAFALRVFSCKVPLAHFHRGCTIWRMSTPMASHRPCTFVTRRRCKSRIYQVFCWGYLNNRLGIMILNAMSVPFNSIFIRPINCRSTVKRSCWTYGSIESFFQDLPLLFVRRYDWNTSWDGLFQIPEQFKNKAWNG